MRLEQVQIAGFRGYDELISIPFHNLTALTGRNDAGKSSILEALNNFFNPKKPDQLDFTVGACRPIEITCTFGNLPPDVILDASYSTTLKSEYLLDLGNNLTITKRWTQGKTNPEVFAQAVHPVGENLPFLLSQKQASLRSIALELGISDDQIGDRRVNKNYRQEIWRHWLQIDAARLELTEVPLIAEDGKQVANSLELIFPLFQIFRADRQGTEADEIAQDPAKAIVRSVLSRHAETLEKLTADIGAELRGMLSNVIERLEEVAPALAASLSPSNLEPVWSKAFSSLQFTDEHDVPLSRRGSGTRRLVLLSFFRAEAERTYDVFTEKWRRGVIIAVEEPETALHPDLQRESLSALNSVASRPDRQVIITTHSSNLVRLLPLESVRYINREEHKRSCSFSSQGSRENFLAEMEKSLGIFSDHNVRCFVMVEGKHDITALHGLSKLMAEVEPDLYYDLSAAEKKGEVCMLPIGGCGAATLWQSRMSPFARPEVHVLDSDRNSASAELKPEIKKYLRACESREGSVSAHILQRREMENYLPLDAIISTLDHLNEAELRAQLSDRLSFESEEHAFADVPVTVAEICHILTATTTSQAWPGLTKEARDDKESRVKKRLANGFSHGSVREYLISLPDTSLLIPLQNVASAVWREPQFHSSGDARL